MNLNRLILLMIALLLLPGLLVACDGDDDDNGEEPTTAPTTPAGEVTEPAGQASTVDVGLTEFQISMPTTASAGTVTFNVTNNGTEEHSFEIEGNGIEEALASHLQPGESGSLTVELAPGTYEIYCPVEDHADQGMRLELTVQ